MNKKKKTKKSIEKKPVHEFTVKKNNQEKKIDSYSDYEWDIKLFYDSFLSTKIDWEDYSSIIQKICKDYDDKLKSNISSRKKIWEKSTIKIILYVQERIRAVDFLQNKQETNEFSNSLRGLSTYLALTCFDKLGQPDNYKSFDSWLSVKKKRKKEKLDNEINKISYKDKSELILEAYKFYQNIYGVKKSFFKFINEILPNTTKTELLDRIRIAEMKGISVQKYKDDEAKKKYLYQIRNDYTHGLKFTGLELGKNETEGIPNPKEKFILREKNLKNNEEIHYETSIDFASFLKEVVIIGLIEYVKTK